MPATVTIRRIYNNNVVLGLDATGVEVVLLGKGIGFQRKPGEEVGTTGSQRFWAEGRYKAAMVADLFSDATADEIEVAQAIVELAHEELNTKASEALLIHVLDHLLYAVRRARQGTMIDFPLRWEVGQLYPDEAGIGRRAVLLVNERLGVSLQEDEWVAFALHFINQQWVGGDVSKTLAMTEAIGQVVTLLAERWNTPIDRHSRSAARFVTHLRYLFARVGEDRQVTTSGIDVMAAVLEADPGAAEVALEIGQLIASHAARDLTPEEIAYLALHTSRLYAEVKPHG